MRELRLGKSEDEREHARNDPEECIIASALEELSCITKRTIAGWTEEIEWSTAIYA